MIIFIHLLFLKVYDNLPTEDSYDDNIINK